MLAGPRGLRATREPVGLAVLLGFAAAVCAASACGARQPGETARVDRRVAGSAASPAGEGQASPVPTFARDVAPIVFRRCTTCHNPAGPAPFSLASYGDLAPLAERIAQVTARHIMPPWQPDPDVGNFADARRLTTDEIETIRRWVEAGAPEGDPSATPEPPEWPGGWQLGVPDLVIEMPRPFAVPADGPDLFRNFVIAIPTEEARRVSAVELQPGNRRLVHHATILLDATGHSRWLATRDTTPGFPGMHAGGRAAPPPGFILGWTPGRVPHEGDAGLSWRLEPGTDLVLQLHLRPSGRPESVRARAGFHFTDKPARKRPVVLRLASETVDVPAGESAYVVEDSYELPVPVRLLGLHPHAHYLARRMEVSADLPQGTRRDLLRIEDWNFDWQDFYRLAEPLLLPRGTVLRMRYSYDNSVDNPQNPHDPPRRVVYGPTGTDEMGDLWIQVLPVDTADATGLRRDFARKSLETRVAGWRHAIRVRPGDARAHYGLGTILLRRGRLDEAVSHLRTAVESESDHPHARFHLGLALQARGDLDEALDAYRRAADTDPRRADIRFNLALALVAAERPDEAIGVFAEGARLEPADTRAHVAMAWVLVTPARSSLRRPGVAVELAGIAMRRSSTPTPSARAALAAALAAGGDVEGAAREVEEAFAAAVERGDTRLIFMISEHLEAYRAGRVPDFGGREETR